MKAIFTSIALCLLYSLSFSQQRPQLTQYMQNSFLVNPAVAGIESYADLRAGYRSQWVGIEGAPKTFYTSIHAALNKHDRNAEPLGQRNNISLKSNANRNNRFYQKPHHGIGAIAQVDQAGIIRASTLSVSYAYHLPITQTINLSSGVNAGVTQISLNRNLFMQTPNDPFIYGDMANMLKLDVGLGMWLYSQDFYVGVSGAQLTGGRNQPYAVEEGPRTRLQPHYYLTGGYRVGVSNELSLTPSIMIKNGGYRQTAVDLNLKALYGQQFWVGFSYRHEDAVAGMVGFYLNHLFDVSYAYDFAISDLSRVNANSHELIVGFKLNNPNRIVCPKWIW